MLTSATDLTTLSARRSSWAGRTVISTPCLTTKSNNPVIIKKLKGWQVYHLYGTMLVGIAKNSLFDVLRKESFAYL